MATLADRRREYEAQVRALRPVADQMLAAAFPEEVVARTMFAAREALKGVHKRRLTAVIVGEIASRNINLYGGDNGPTIGDLFADHGSWTAVVDAACRYGGRDLHHLLWS